MTANGIPRDFWSEPLPNRAGFIAKYQAPGVGVRTVKMDGVLLRESGKPAARIFDSKIEAEIAAARAKDEAEDRGRQPTPRTAKIFRSTGVGRNRRAVSV
jgi:hypothetical protein